MRSWKAIFWAALCGLGVGCRGNQRQDTVIAWVVNPSHTWRATIVLRESFIDGHVDDAPMTYVLLDQGSGAPHYDNGQDFPDAAVVMKSTRCGPLSLKWLDDQALQITCEKCGLALNALGPHPTGVGAIRVDYAGFPEHSSWEPAPQPR
jgi:hypothetical protein